jgi:hypothetical protein
MHYPSALYVWHPPCSVVRHVKLTTDKNLQQACVIGAVTDGLCAPTNQTCICSDEAFQQNVTACVREACTIPDALRTSNSSPCL